MVYVKRRSRLPPDTLIGVFMALTLGLGICLLVAATQAVQHPPDRGGDVREPAHGDRHRSPPPRSSRRRASSLVLCARVQRAPARQPRAPAGQRRRAWTRRSSSTSSWCCSRWPSWSSLKVIGALLVEALVVVPAAAARNLARSTRGYVAWSIACGAGHGRGGDLRLHALPRAHGRRRGAGARGVFLRDARDRRLALRLRCAAARKARPRQGGWGGRVRVVPYPAQAGYGSSMRPASPLVPAHLRLVAAALLGLAALGAVSLASPPAAAQTEEELTRLRQLFTEGRQLEGKGQWAEALKKFEAVAASKMTPQIRFHMALCEENMGRLVSALRGFELAAREAKEMGSAGVDALTPAVEHADAIRPRIAKLEIDVHGKLTTSKILLDDTALAPKDSRGGARRPGPARDRGARRLGQGHLPQGADAAREGRGEGGRHRGRPRRAARAARVRQPAAPDRVAHAGDCRRLREPRRARRLRRVLRAPRRERLRHREPLQSRREHHRAAAPPIRASPARGRRSRSPPIPSSAWASPGP